MDKGRLEGPIGMLGSMKMQKIDRALENSRLALGWNLNRTLAKINYHIHTDAIKDMLIPPDITPQRQSITYASGADVLNVALFGMTAKERRRANPDAKGNIRDEASLQQLIVLANFESINAELMPGNCAEGSPASPECQCQADDAISRRGSSN